MVILLGFVLCLFSSVVNSANLTLELNSNSVEMGKYLTATFTYEGSTKPELIDLELWQTHFYIEQKDPDFSQISPNSITSITKAKLYPRKTGTISLDAIAQGGSFVKPRQITILPSIRNAIDATPQVHSIQPKFWADEPIIINIDVPLHYARNEVIAKEWLLNGFNISPLPTIKIKNNVQLKWLIYTPSKGVYSLELPAIVQRGRGRFRYHSPKLQFTVKPLPAYLPSSVATGNMTISSQILSKGGQKLMQITFKKKGYLPQNIEGFQRFINDLSSNELALNIQTAESIDQGITTRQILITLPNRLWGQNLKLNVSYFNTQTGHLDTIEHQLPTVYTLPKQAQYFIIALSLIAVLFSLKLLNQAANKWRQQNTLKQRIRQAQTPQALRSILLSIHQSKTLEEWANKNSGNNATHIKDNLNQACYQVGNSIDLQALKKALISRKTNFS